MKRYLTKEEIADDPYLYSNATLVDELLDHLVRHRTALRTSYMDWESISDEGKFDFPPLTDHTVEYLAAIQYFATRPYTGSSLSEQEFNACIHDRWPWSDEWEKQWDMIWFRAMKEEHERRVHRVDE